MKSAACGLSLFLLVGCGGAEQPPVHVDPVVAMAPAEAQPLRLEHHVGPHEALAYRWHREEHGHGMVVYDTFAYVERTLAGTLVVRPSDERVIGASLPGGGSALLRVVFPTPSEPLDASLVDRFSDPGLGETSEQLLLGFASEDRYALRSREGGLARIDVSRTYHFAPIVDGTTEIAITYDEAHARFEQVTAADRSLTDWTRWAPRANDGVDGQLDLRVDSTLTYDEAASRERSALLVRLAQEVAAGRAEHAAYLGEHGAQREVDAALALSPEEGGERIAFHLAGRPEVVWARALALEGQARGRAIEMLSMSYLMPQFSQRLPEDVAAVLRPHVGSVPELDAFVARIADPALRPELERLARGRSTRTRAAARAALRQLDPIDAAALRAVARDLSRFMELGHRVFATDDPRFAVPVLIELLPAAEPQFMQPLLVQWLEGITRVVLGTDVEAWRAFYAAHQALPYSQWIVEAANGDNALVRVSAYQALGAMPRAEGAMEALVRDLGDSRLTLRAAAATTLARWGDARGARVLVELLDAPESQVRRTALGGLAHVMPSTFGYASEGSEEERARAIGRLSGWCDAALRSP